MKTKINALIVVEGKSDIDLLATFIDADFYSVNGSAIEQKDFDFINSYLSRGNVIILTDPDFPGIQIRNKINEHCKGALNSFVRKEFSIKNNKVGVAESSKEEILLALKNAQKFDELNKGNLTSFDLYELGITGNDDSFSKRKYLSEYFHLGFTNSKTFLKRLNMLKISKNEILEVLKDVK